MLTFTIRTRALDPLGRERILRFSMPDRGGYVYLDDTDDGSRPGTSGRQPADDGSTLRATPETFTRACRAWVRRNRWQD